MKLKYIIVLSKDFLQNESVIVFDSLLNHKDVAGTHQVVSAGFCRISVFDRDEVDVEVWGESVTLDIKSRKEDAEIIKKAWEFEI
jgi:hypothetical protein